MTGIFLCSIREKQNALRYSEGIRENQVGNERRLLIEFLFDWGVPVAFLELPNQLLCVTTGQSGISIGSFIPACEPLLDIDLNLLQFTYDAVRKHFFVLRMKH